MVPLHLLTCKDQCVFKV